MSRIPDVAVVGAGVVGHAVAVAVGRRGHDVVLVGDPAAAGTATVAAGAMLGALGEVTTAEESSTPDIRLRLEAADGYPDWLDGLAGLVGERPSTGSGTYIVAGAHAPTDAANLAAIRAAAMRFASRFEDVAPREVPDWRPAPSRPGAAALYLPDEGWVDAPELLRVLASAVRRGRGTTATTATVSQVLLDGGRAVGVRTSAGETIHAHRVVLAAGCGNQTILDATPPLAGALPRIVPGKGVSMTLSPGRPGGPAHTAVLRTPNRDFACGLHLVPRGDGAVYIGATNRVASHLARVGDATVDEARHLLDALPREIDAELSRWRLGPVVAGNRPISTDGRPQVGCTDVDGLFVASGTYRNGVLLAPVLAELVADEIELDDVSPDNPYSARGRGAKGKPALAVLESGIAELAAFLSSGEGSTDPAADLHRLLSALFGAVLDPRVRADTHIALDGQADPAAS